MMISTAEAEILLLFPTADETRYFTLSTKAKATKVHQRRQPLLRSTSHVYIHIVLCHDLWSTLVIYCRQYMGVH